MPVNFLEIAVQSGVITAILAGIGLYMRYKYVPRLKTELRQGVGLAIGAWMKGLSEEAEAEGGGGVPGASGQINLGGFKIDVSTIKELLVIAPQALQIAKMLGLTGGGGGSGTGGKIGL